MLSVLLYHYYQEIEVDKQKAAKMGGSYLPPRLSDSHDSGDRFGSDRNIPDRHGNIYTNDRPGSGRSDGDRRGAEWPGSDRTGNDRPGGNRPAESYSGGQRGTGRGRGRRPLEQNTPNQRNTVILILSYGQFYNINTIVCITSVLLVLLIYSVLILFTNDCIIFECDLFQDQADKNWPKSPSSPQDSNVSNTKCSILITSKVRTHTLSSS